MEDRYLIENPPVEFTLQLAIALFVEQEISYSWNEIETLVRWDPELFRCALSRARNSKYVERSGSQGNVSLWIACNLVETMRKAPWCYFCARPIAREEFLVADAHVEHFEPRSNAGTHEPANVTLSCASCDELKSHLTGDDFQAILDDADSFFAAHGRERKRPEQLEEFAEIHYPRVAGFGGYAQRHGIEVRQAREHWETLKRHYRRKWQTSS